MTQMMGRTVVAGFVTLMGGLTSPVVAGAATWPDTYVGRLEVLAAMESLNGSLLAGPSATATLQAWCADHHIASAQISAERVTGADKPITAQQRQDLQVGPDEPIKYRRVRLACGGHVLSVADNWYAPSRLTPEMNRLLDTTDTPFGVVVRPMHPVRQTLSVEHLWSPLPADWDLKPDGPSGPDGGGALVIPADLFRHRAVLFDDRRRPLAEVVETYTGETLNYPR